MRAGVLLGKIRLPSNLPSLVARIMDDWRGIYSSCKTRRLSIYVLEEEHQRLRALADSFYSAFRDNEQVEFDETQYRVFSSVIVQGSEKKILFPYDLFIHESHAEVLPIVADRLRNSSGTIDERVFIDRLALDFERVKIILKKNDVRIIKLLTDTHFIENVGNLFPTEAQVARQLGVTEATAEMRIRRLMDVHAIQLRYMPNPSSFDCSIRLVEHPWPLQPNLRKDCMYSFEYTPKRGISCLITPSKETLTLNDSSVFDPTHFLFSWNLEQLDQWNKPSWEIRTQLTADREEEEETPMIAIDVELKASQKSEINRKDVEAIDILQKTQGIDTDLLEKHFGVAQDEVQKKLNWLIKEKYCIILPHFLHIGLENTYFIYFEGKDEQLTHMQKNLKVFPQTELLIAEDRILGVISLPKHWSHDFALDAEELKLEGYRIFYRAVSRAAVHDPCKRASYLWEKSTS
ncbi:MAG: hypothetical protein ACXACI_10380 [Candidatus Hodarchaeales archaeon]